MAIQDRAVQAPVTQAKSQHLAESVLQPFLQADFDAADYFNNTLPTLSIAGPSKEQTGRVSLAELSSRTQSLLSQLNAQTSRLSDVLTQMTDEMIRGGSRLAYEVEILKGETVGLAETLQETLKDERTQFSTSQGIESNSQEAHDGQPTPEPDYITQLRTLSLVRARLDSVVKVFGEAMQWPLAPSELTSSFISVSGPEVTAEESRSREEKGQEAARRLRDEVTSLLETAVSAEEGVTAAAIKVEQLKELSLIWKGTAEEKTRNRHIDNLGQLIEDEEKKLANRSQGRRQGYSTIAASATSRSNGVTSSTQESGYGFINNLKRFKGDIYLD